MIFILDLEYQSEKTFEENKNIASVVDLTREDILRIFSFDKECISVGKLLYKRYENKNSFPLVVRNSGGGTVFHSKEDICIASFHKLKDARIVIREIATRVVRAIENVSGKKPKIVDNGDVILDKKIFGVALGRFKNIWIAEGVIKMKPQKIISEDNCFKENGFLNIENNRVINSIIYTFQNE